MHRIAIGGGGGRGGFGGGGGRGAPAAAPPRDARTGAVAAAGGGRGRGGRGGGGGLQPGNYSVRLTVDGQTYTQPVAIKPDPRGVPAAIE